MESTLNQTVAMATEDKVEDQVPVSNDDVEEETKATESENIDESDSLEAQEEPVQEESISEDAMEEVEESTTEEPVQEEPITDNVIEEVEASTTEDAVGGDLGVEDNGPISEPVVEASVPSESAENVVDIKRPIEVEVASPEQYGIDVDQDEIYREEEGDREVYQYIL